MSDLALILLAIIICFLLLAFLLRKWVSESSRPDNPALTQWLTLMHQSLESTNKTLHETLRGSSTQVSQALQENSKAVSDRLDNASRIISQLQKNLGEMTEVSRGIKTLQEFLQSPKLRGGIGEQILGEMIGQTFPKNAFHLQYSFKSGVKVDAVLKTDAGLLCIDSKFPMENFQSMLNAPTQTARDHARRQFVSDVRKHITDISHKYILPEENTMDFALMYIPSESVYYEVVNIVELSELARRNRVYSVSPNTLYAHLQVLLQSLQGRELEAQSKELLKILRSAQKDYSKASDNLSTLGRHLTNAHHQMLGVTQSFGLLGQKLAQTESLGGISDPPSTLHP